MPPPKQLYSNENQNCDSRCHGIILKYSKQYINVHSSFIYNNSKKCKQVKCSSTGDWIKELWCIHAEKHHSEIKRDKLLIHTTAGMNLRNTGLKEVRHKEARSAWLHKAESSQRTQSASACLGLGRRATDCKRHAETFWGNGDALYLGYGDGYTGIYLCQKPSTCTLHMGAFYFG